MKKETFGERLTRLREAQGLSQGALAKCVKLTQQRVCQLEHKDNENVRVPVARSLAKALGCSLSQVLGE